jgi:hypothetical protein
MKPDSEEDTFLLIYWHTIYILERITERETPFAY